MFVTAIIFMIIASRYREESYIQNREEKPKPLGDELADLEGVDNK